MIRSLLFGSATAIVVMALAPGVAASSPPDPAPHPTPSVIEVMGVDGAGTPDPGAAFAVFTRDFANNPLPGAQVVVDFSHCDDLRLSHQSSGLVNPALAGQVLDCATETVRGVTDAQGRVQLSVLGAGLTYEGGPESGPGQGCARFYVDGVFIGTATVHIYDLNGAANNGSADGVDISDLARWLVDFGSGNYFGRSDYSPNSPGFMGIDDFSFWLGRFGLGRSASGTLGAGFCP